MEKLRMPSLDPGPAFNNPKTNSVTLAPSSRLSSTPRVNSQAALHVDRMLDLLPPLDVGNPETWIAATVDEFSRYPEEVMAAAAREIPRRSERPTQKLIAEVLAAIYEPIERQIARERAWRDFKRALPAPRRQRTDEEQKRIDDLVQKTRRELGIPAGGLQRRTPVLPPSADAPYYSAVHAGRADGKHALRVQQDLEARAARRAHNTEPQT